MEIWRIVFASIFVNNYVLTKFLGICPFLGVSKNLKSAFGMGCAVTFVMALANTVIYPIYYYVLKPYSLEYLETAVFILVIASLVQIVEAVVKKALPFLYLALGIYLPLITTNCAVFAVVKNNISDGYTFLNSLVSSISCGLGFVLAIVLFSGIRQRIENERVPAAFQGLPITLISAGIMALAFYGVR